MTESEFLSKERYPYEVANFLGVSLYRVRKIIDEVVTDDDVLKNCRKLPKKITERVINYYNTI